MTLSIVKSVIFVVHSFLFEFDCQLNCQLKHDFKCQRI